jgi:hypothetical protein
MADEWNPAKYVVEELGRLYVYADGRVEGGIYPPGCYKYPPDDELYGGNWEDGLQAIEDFDWGNGAQSTLGIQAFPREEGRPEDEENIDWVQKAVDIDRETEATTLHEPLIKALPQPVTSYLPSHGVHKNTASSPPITIHPTQDESENIEMQDTFTRNELQGLLIRTFEAPVIESSSVSLSPRVIASEKDREDVVGTTMEDEVVNKQAALQDPPALHSLSESVSTLQNTGAEAEAQELLKKVEEPDSTYFVEPTKATNASEEFGDSAANLVHEGTSTKNPSLDDHEPIHEKGAMEMFSRDDQGPFTPFSSSKDSVPRLTVAPSADEFHNSNLDPSTNVQSNTKEAVVETSFDDPPNTLDLLALSLSKLLHISEDDNSAHESTKVDVENKDRMEVEILAVSNIFEEPKKAPATPLEDVSNTLPLAVGFDVTHTLENTGTNTTALGTDESVVGATLSIVGHGGSDVTPSSNIKDMEDGSVCSRGESSANKSDTLRVHLQTRGQDDLAKPDDNLLTCIRSDTTSSIMDSGCSQTQDTTLLPVPLYLGGEDEEMSKTGAIRVSLPTSEPPSSGILYPESLATGGGKIVEHDDDAIIVVPSAITEASSDLSDIPSHILQQAVHDLHSTDQDLSVYDDRLAEASDVSEDAKPDSAPWLFQSELLKLTTHTTNLTVDVNNISPYETKDDDISLAKAPIQENNEISLIGNTDAMEIDVGVEEKGVILENEHDDKMDLDDTTAAVPLQKSPPKIPATHRTLQNSVARVPSMPVGASRFVYLRGSNSFQPASQDLKRSHAQVSKSSIAAEKMNNDVKLESDEEMPPRKKSATKSIPTITNVRPSSKGKKKQVPSDDEVDVEDENMDAVVAAIHSKKDENDDMDDSLEYIPSVSQTSEKFQLSASNGLPAHPKGDTGTKILRGLLAAAAATTSPIKNLNSVTTRQTSKSLGAGTFAPPAKQPPQLPVLETSPPPGKKSRLSKSLTHSRTGSNSTSASFAELLTPWGRPSTRSESKFAPRPNYNLAIDGDDLDDEGDMRMHIRPTSLSKATRAKIPLKKVSTIKKPQSRQKKDSKKERESSIDNNSTLDVEDKADDREATEALVQPVSGPGVTNTSGDLSETDPDRLLVATMFQKSPAKAKGRPTARKPSASKKSTANASKNGVASTVKTTTAPKSSAAKLSPAFSTKATAASKTSVKDTPAPTAKTPVVKAAKPTNTTPPVKSTSTPQSILAATPSTASPTRNKYGFTTKTNTRVNTRSQATALVTPTTATIAAHIKKNGKDATSNNANASSTLGTGAGTSIDFGTKTAKANATLGNESVHTKADFEVPNPIGTPLKGRTRAGKVEKEKTKGATAAALTPLDAPSSATKTKDATPEADAVTTNDASDTSSKLQTIKSPAAPIAKRTRASKAEEDRAKEEFEKETNIGKRLRGAGQDAEKSSAESLKKGSVESPGGKKGERRKSALS